MTPTQEEWRPVLGYEGYYEVSDHGRVRSVDRVVPSGQGAHLRRQRGKVLKARRHDASDARRVVSLSKNGRVIAARIAPLVLAAFVGPCPDGMEGCHNDGDCTNDLLSNLRWDTRSANNLDAVRHRTHHAARKTHCKRGHALVPPNLTAFSMANGIRWCLACGKARSAAHYASSKGRPFDMQAAADRHYRRIMEESPCLAT